MCYLTCTCTRPLASKAVKCSYYIIFNALWRKVNHICTCVFSCLCKYFPVLSVMHLLGCTQDQIFYAKKYLRIYFKVLFHCLKLFYNFIMFLTTNCCKVVLWYCSIDITTTVCFLMTWRKNYLWLFYLWLWKKSWWFTLP